MVWGFESPPAHTSTEWSSTSWPSTVETLEKLERKITLTLPATDIRRSRVPPAQAGPHGQDADGFRPGKVPMNVVAQRYGYSVQYEVMNDKVGEAFATPPTKPSCAWPVQPRITEKEGSPEGQMAFDATFEVYPEVTIGDLTRR
jgi:trigger factor